MATTNSLSTKTLRDKYRAAQIMQALRNAVVAEQVCMVDRTDLKTISSPYITAMSTVVQAVVGTYSPANITTTDDTLTVADEFIVSGQIKGFEKITSNFDLFFAANQAMTNSVVTAIDKWVVNNLCEDGTGTYSTPAGGFTTAANVVTIISNIIGKCSGYADALNGLYVIVESTDIPGIVQSQVSTGFRYADETATNGLMGSMLGVDVYVVRAGTFVDATTTSASGTKTWTNLGHRVGGVKKVSTYAFPRGLQFEEKGVTGVTGMEVVCYGLVGFKQWTPTADLTIDITLA
jgi:hypothetical protein